MRQAVVMNVQVAVLKIAQNAALMVRHAYNVMTGINCLMETVMNPVPVVFMSITMSMTSVLAEKHVVQHQDQIHLIPLAVGVLLLQELLMGRAVLVMNTEPCTIVIYQQLLIITADIIVQN
jgi:hypothetical protein